MKSGALCLLSQRSDWYSQFVSVGRGGGGEARSARMMMSREWATGSCMMAMGKAVLSAKSELISSESSLLS